jgi:7-cyano-7-deazaguanine synthase in queuosine biosynthesis
MNEKCYKTIAKMLQEFGYPDCTPEMIEETHKAIVAEQELPHGIIGMFAYCYINELRADGRLQD